MNTPDERKKEYDQAKEQERNDRLRNAPTAVTGTPLDQQEQLHPDTRHKDTVPNGIEIGDGGQASHKSGGHADAQKLDSARGGKGSGAGSHPVGGAFGKE